MKRKRSPGVRRGVKMEMKMMMTMTMKRWIMMNIMIFIMGMRRREIKKRRRDVRWWF